ncbi:hypothetical protein ACQEVF_32645 [Nonomuraea polychroma]|uniref:hypothetical protein n=1 Tax=Nonomuraea polychroma TaxID=46176 RepID=UPI003D8AF431
MSRNQTPAAELSAAIEKLDTGQPGAARRVLRAVLAPSPGRPTQAPAAVPALPSGTAVTPNIYPRAWACWAAGVAVSFAAIELAALRQAPGHGTLTAQLRRNPKLSAAAIAAFGVWAVHHVAMQGSDIKKAASC